MDEGFGLLSLARAATGIEVVGQTGNAEEHQSLPTRVRLQLGDIRGHPIDPARAFGWPIGVLAPPHWAELELDEDGRITRTRVGGKPKPWLRIQRIVFELELSRFGEPIDLAPWVESTDGP